MRTNNQETKRIAYIDIAKGIGILLVILGHLLENPKNVLGLNIKEAIYSFHMPLFFLLSGITYKAINEANIKNTFLTSIKKKKYIFFAYLIYSIVFILWDACAFVIGQKELEIIPLDVYKTIVFEGINVLWFLSTLLLSEVLFDLLNMIAKQRTFYLGGYVALLFSLAILAYSNLVLIMPKRIFIIFLRAILRPCICLFFFYLGYLIKRINLFERYNGAVKTRIIKSVIALVGSFFFMLTGIRNGLIDIHSLTTGNNPVVFAIVGIAIPIFIILFCSELNDSSILVRSLVFFGKNSLFIMVTHNYLGIRLLCELCSSLLFKNYEMQIITSFVLIIIIEAVLTFCVGEKINMFLKSISKQKVGMK